MIFSLVYVGSAREPGKHRAPQRYVALAPMKETTHYIMPVTFVASHVDAVAPPIIAPAYFFGDGSLK
jgi:hypothetical protein